MSDFVTVQDVTFGYGRRVILDDVTLHFGRGQVVAIMGGSGMGKTTLLKLIGGIETPDKGAIFIDGEPLDTSDKEKLYAQRRRMGMLFQFGALFTDMSVLDNVAFPLREQTKLSEELIIRMALMKLNAVGLRGAADLMPSEISGGMSRRVALARATALDPELIMYDEPFAGLDPISMGVTARLIRDLNDALNATSIIVTHDVPETFAIADYVYMISSGRIAAEGTPAEYKEVFQAWIENQNDADKTKKLAEKIIPMVEAAKDKCANCATIAELSHFLVKRSQWIIGGDGASYDIGYGGLDHVIASGEDVNILVLDTEVYSNTGGQSSKATPLGAIAKFAASGKRVRKKDLGMIATTYGYVYVAQIAMGADQAQTLKAIREAEAYPGPSLVIAYAPCINHGLKAGMGKSQAEEAKAVECGYWHLWRFNPALEEEGKNPFMLDSKEPKWEGFQDFLKNEVRFASVMKQYPAEAADLFAACEEMAKKRYASYKRMEAMNWGE